MAPAVGLAKVFSARNLVLAGTAALVVLLGWLRGFRADTFTLVPPRGPSRQVEEPFLRDREAPNSEWEMRGTIRFGPLAARVLHVVAADQLLSLEINGRAVDLDRRLLSGARDDRWAGGHWDVAGLVHAGPNAFKARFYSETGHVALRLGSSALDRRFLALAFVWWPALLALVWQIFRRLGAPRVVVAILLGALLLRLAYLSYTGPRQRTHDVDGHIEYVTHVLEHRSLPDVHAGWQTYQPPLYYVSAALLSQVVRGASADVPLADLQAYSVALSMLFLFFAWRIIALYFGAAGWRTCLATALVAAWPSLIIHSVRIGNDGLSYLLFAMSLYYALAWFAQARRRDLVWSLVWLTAALLTKSTALILAGFVGGLLLARGWRAWRESGRSPAALRSLWPPLVALALVVLVTSVLQFRVPILDNLRGRGGPILVANAGGLPESLRVGTGLANYLGMDLDAYFLHPYTSNWSDVDTGRRYFSNLLLKTALFGEWSHDRRLSIFAIVLSWLLVLALGVSVAALVRLALRRRLREEDVALGALVAALLAGLAYVRFSQPFSSCNDFRFILPVVIPATVLFFRGFELAGAEGEAVTRVGRGLTLAGIALAGLFVLLSLHFFLVPLLRP